MTPEQENFISSKDIADSIRIEASIIPPKKEAILQETAKLITETFVDKYGQFIPEKTKRLLKGIEKRVFFVKDPSLIASTWVKEAETKVETERPKERIILDGNCVFLGSLSFIETPAHVWQKLSSEFQAEILKNFEGDQEESEMFARGLFLAPVLTEEILHQLHDSNLPNLYSHCGICYYSKEILDKLEIPYSFSDKATILTEYYDHFIQLFGDDVHSLFFDRYSIPALRRFRIYANLYPLPPNYAEICE